MSFSTDLFPKLHEKIFLWSYNGIFGRNFQKIVDIQMWCLGCDIRCAEGNLLLKYGFHRDRPSAHTHGTSHYSKQVGGNSSIHLWGFGMALSNQNGALLIKRFSRTPRIIDTPLTPGGITHPHQLPNFFEPRTNRDKAQARALLHTLCRELLVYEEFVATVTPSTYRPSVLKNAPALRRLHDISLSAHAWRPLVEALASTNIDCRLAS